MNHRQLLSAVLVPLFSLAMFAGCEQGESGEPVDLVQGSISYEARFASKDGAAIVLSNVSTIPAQFLLTFLYDAEGNLLGATYTDEKGEFEIQSSRYLEGGEFVLFTTVFLPDGEADPVVGVLNPTQGGDLYNGKFKPWTWKFDVPSSGKVGDKKVTESQGSGALFLYLFNVFAYRELSSNLINNDFSKVNSLAILWAPGISWSCGACYWSSGTQKMGETQFDQSIFIGGEPDGSSAWGWAVTLHEFGHFAAQNYSRDDSTGGPHNLGTTIAPAFAWSEGWASFFAASTISRWIEQPLPLYWDIQGGSSFWVDYGSATAASGGLVQSGIPIAPDPHGDIFQDLDEYWVATMLWHIWDGSDLPDGSSEGDYAAVGIAAIFRAISSNRFMNYNRGAQGADFVDFLDSVVCANNAIATDIQGTVFNYLGFPYTFDDNYCP